MKPILFNTEMVKAIFDGRKTVTRRLVKPQPVEQSDCIHKQFFNLHSGTNQYACSKCGYGVIHNGSSVIKSKYQLGDILYVRETYANTWSPEDDSGYVYKVDGNPSSFPYWGNISSIKHNVWRPSIHMPKEAARIFLQVMGVRCERLQQITDNGAISEGINPIPRSRELCSTDDGIYPFKALWNSVYHNWDENPWVWVIEFERITKEEAQKG